MASLESQSEQCEQLLDRGAWKHTWHLPKTRYGYIDWDHADTIKAVAEAKEGAIQEAKALLALAESIEIPAPTKKCLNCGDPFGDEGVVCSDECGAELKDYHETCRMPR